MKQVMKMKQKIKYDEEYKRKEILFQFYWAGLGRDFENMLCMQLHKLHRKDERFSFVKFEITFENVPKCKITSSMTKY